MRCAPGSDHDVAYTVFAMHDWSSGPSGGLKLARRADLSALTSTVSTELMVSVPDLRNVSSAHLRTAAVTISVALGGFAVAEMLGG